MDIVMTDVQYDNLTFQLQQLYNDYVTILSETSDPISHLSSTNTIISDDLFLVSRCSKDEHNVNDDAIDNILINLLIDDGFKPDTYEFEQKKTELRRLYETSFKCSYAKLSNDLFADISSSFKFGTMAYKDVWEYAKLGHIHPYSNFHIYPLYQVSNEIQTPEQLTNLLAVFHVTNDGVTDDISICLPRIDFSPIETEPLIGEVKMLALNDSKLPRLSTYFDNPIGPNQPYRLKPNVNFNGWVWLDGSLFAKDDFPDAWEIYRNMPRSTASMFEVPDYMNQFVKPNPRLNTYANPIENMPYHNGLPTHTHEITGEMLPEDLSDIVMNATFNFDNYSTGDGGAHLHSGNKYDPQSPLNLTIKFNNNINMKPLTNTESNGPKLNNNTIAEVESYPAYVSIPSLVYIGRKKPL